MVTLDGSEIFKQLQPPELEALRGIAQERSFAIGQDIFKEGDLGDGLYFIRDGEVEISGLLSDQARHHFSQVFPGDIFGEMAVLEDKPRSATATARKTTDVYFFERAHMLKLLQNSSALSLVLLKEISQRLREFNRQYLSEVIQTERLAVVGRFARSIVHDLKNPLNVIGLTAEMAGAEHVPLEMRRQAQARIRKQVDRISEMIGEILDFTSGAQSSVVLAMSDYAEFVQYIIKEIGPEAAIKSTILELQTDLPEVKVLIDPKRLRRVFYNLVVNATDAMPRGGKVFLRIQRTGNEVVTDIEDTGPGIAAEIADRLFDAFATHGKAHGTGLGLSISKKIVEDHHGWIKARNKPGGGAIFSFGLPVAK